MAGDWSQLLTVIFKLGLTQNEMVDFFSSKGLEITTRQLRRYLRRYGLRRREFSNWTHTVDFVQEQLLGSGHLHEYRWMHVKCKVNGLNVRKEDIRLMLTILDPAGVASRAARRLRRREYYAKGPNFIWHLDSYDKIKRYGFCINGCIDGLSRKILWLNVYRTSSDPKVIAGYFTDAIQTTGGTATLIRGDHGTENCYVKVIQELLLNDRVLAEQQVYLSGPSTANQRIESFWGQLRRECMEFWMETFRNLQDSGSFVGDFMDINILQFAFMAIIQDELDRVTSVWNNHIIRRSSNVNIPYGRPNCMYYTPEIFNCRDYLQNVSQLELDICKQYCVSRESISCDEQIFNECCEIMQEENIDIPDTRESAEQTYLYLRQILRAR